MTNNIVAQRYAKALFDLGSQQGPDELDSYVASLENLNAALQTFPMLGRVLQTPTFTTEEKQNVLSKLAAKLKTNKVVINFCLLLVEKNRMDCFTTVVERFKALWDNAKGIVRGKLTTAIELDDAKKKDVLSDLQAKTGHSLDLEFDVSSNILGGVVLKVGDQVMDASLRAQLSILKDTIQRGE